MITETKLQMCVRVLSKWVSSFRATWWDLLLHDRFTIHHYFKTFSIRRSGISQISATATKITWEITGDNRVAIIATT